MDIDMYLFIEKGLRREISYIAKRYSKSNNKHMNNYDPKKRSKFITYLDMNNLYGWAMSSYLSYGAFKWLKNVDEFDINSVSKKSRIGYILDVDLQYPDELHVFHNDFPLAREKPANSYDMSDYCKKIADEHEVKVGDIEKLLENLGNKTNHVLHYRNLSFGMKLTKIHKVLKFNKYIDFNIAKRKMLLIVLKKIYLI